ncbi:hypothetical protein C8F04DRAFT_1195671 [Mycena alexandri]|uniref:Uncharacterized protein n=1 Tax=Mycena alexandri TaxID=1745969 RepID=A0AAD6S5I1_9AGAR|nr:hypothetical protein C8F04DRAFT_1195671 [Mycena alexandri]
MPWNLCYSVLLLTSSLPGFPAAHGPPGDSVFHRTTYACSIRTSCQYSSRSYFSVNQKTPKLTGAIHKLVLSAKDANTPGHTRTTYFPVPQGTASTAAEPRQIGNIRIPAYESKLPKNHPPIDIFDAAIAPLTQLLISFPNDHPVVNSYNRFFTKLAMPEPLNLIGDIFEDLGHGAIIRVSYNYHEVLRAIAPP